MKAAPPVWCRAASAAAARRCIAAATAYAAGIRKQRGGDTRARRGAARSVAAVFTICRRRGAPRRVTRAPRRATHRHLEDLLLLRGPGDDVKLLNLGRAEAKSEPCRIAVCASAPKCGSRSPLGKALAAAGCGWAGRQRRARRAQRGVCEPGGEISKPNRQAPACRCDTPAPRHRHSTPARQTLIAPRPGHGHAACTACQAWRRERNAPSAMAQPGGGLRHAHLRLAQQAAGRAAENRRWRIRVKHWRREHRRCGRGLGSGADNPRNRSRARNRGARNSQRGAVARKRRGTQHGECHRELRRG